MTRDKFEFAVRRFTRKFGHQPTIAELAEFTTMSIPAVIRLVQRCEKDEFLEVRIHVPEVLLMSNKELNALNRRILATI